MDVTDVTDVTDAMTIVDISIAEVIVEGLGDVDRLALRESLERHLARLVEERGLPASWRTSGVRADVSTTLEWDGRGGTEGLTAALADRIYRGLGS